jgi:hypothetical protein
MINTTDLRGLILKSTKIKEADGEEWTPKEWIPGPENANVWGAGGRSEQAIKPASGRED